MGDIKIRQMVKYLYDRAYALFIYSPLSLYAVNKEVNFVPQKDAHLHIKETSVTDNNWSVRGEKKYPTSGLCEGMRRLQLSIVFYKPFSTLTH